MEIQPFEALRKQLIQDRDPIKITQSKKIKQSFEKYDEKCLFTCTCQKINDAQKVQERNLIITTKSVYNVKKEDVRKRVPISKLAGLTISQKKLKIIIHVNFESDLYYKVQNYSQFVTIIANILKAYEEFTQDQKLLVRDTPEEELFQLVNYTKDIVNKEYLDGNRMGLQELGFLLEKIRIERQVKKDAKMQMAKQWEKAYSMTQNDNADLLSGSDKKSPGQDVKRYETQDYFRRQSLKMGTQDMENDFEQSYIRQTMDSGSSGDNQYQESQIRNTETNNVTINSQSNNNIEQPKSKSTSRSQNMLLQEELLQEQLRETQAEGKSVSSKKRSKKDSSMSNVNSDVMSQNKDSTINSKSQQKNSTDISNFENGNKNADQNDKSEEIDKINEKEENEEDDQKQAQREKELEEAIIKERKEREEREKKEREEREKKEAEIRRQREEQEKREYLERKREEQIRKMQEEQAKKELVFKKQTEQKYNDLQKFKLRKKEKELEKQICYLQFIEKYHQLQIQIRDLQDQKLERRNQELDTEFLQDFDKNYVDAEKDLEISQNQLRQLRSILKDIEKGHELKQLPNYERAYQLFQFGDSLNEGKSISELIIELDVKYPPEEYLKKLQEQQQVIKNSEISHSPPIDNLQSYEKGSLVGLDQLKQYRGSSAFNTSEIKTYNVRQQN